MSSLPNLLTLARIAVIPVFVAAFYLFGRRVLALGGVRALRRWPAITDAVDGLIARRWQAVSSLGRMLDPIADKLIVAAALLMLAWDRHARRHQSRSGAGHSVPGDSRLRIAGIPCRSRREPAGHERGKIQDRNADDRDIGADRGAARRTSILRASRRRRR